MKASTNASASLTEDTTATPVLWDSLLIFQPSVYSFAKVGVLITIDINLSSIIVNEVGDSSSALPTSIESILFSLKKLPVPSVA